MTDEQQSILDKIAKAAWEANETQRDREAMKPLVTALLQLWRKRTPVGDSGAQTIDLGPVMAENIAALVEAYETRMRGKL